MNFNPDCLKFDQRSTRQLEDIWVTHDWRISLARTVPNHVEVMRRAFKLARAQTDRTLKKKTQSATERLNRSTKRLAYYGKEFDRDMSRDPRLDSITANLFRPVNSERPLIDRSILAARKLARLFPRQLPVAI